MGSAASHALFADAVLHSSRPVPAGVTTARGEPDALRLSVYRNNVFVGLTKVLSQRFPVTERLVGPAFFQGMARLFAQDHKPASPLMMHYGDDFPAFIAGFEPASSLPYLADVASIEVAWTRAYHAADADAINISALAIEPERLPALRFARHPSATLIRSAHPVGSLWASHQQATVTPPEIWQPETVLVVRPAMTVGIHILPPRDAPFAAALLAGQTLGEAAEAASEQDETFDFGTALVGLIGLGAFAGKSFLEDGGPS